MLRRVTHFLDPLLSFRSVLYTPGIRDAFSLREATERSVEMSKGATNWGKALHARPPAPAARARPRLCVVAFTWAAYGGGGDGGDGDAEQTLVRV